MYNLKIAFRNLRRNGVYSVVNVIGLVISLTTCILMALWIQNEFTFDRFHQKADHIYRLNTDVDDFGYLITTPAPLTPIVLENYPEVIDACRITNYYAEFFEYDGRKFYNMNCIAVDNNFFTFFDFPLLQGNVNTPFPDDLSLIISESKAKILFGDEDPVGKSIRSDQNLYFHIVGVAKDASDNSSIQFDFVVPYLSRQRTFGGNWIWKHIDDDWGSYFYQTFFLLRDDANIDVLAKKISNQVTIVRHEEELKYYDEEDEKYEEDSYVFTFQPLKKIHLYEPDGSKSSDMKTLYLLTAIMVFILLIACINYVNIVTARAAKRSREIAMRKIMGANKRKLFSQLLLETIVLLFVSLLIASALIYLLIPYYNLFTGKNLVFSFANSAVWLVYLVTTLGIVLLAGVYPAFSLLSFDPLTAFRSSVGGKKQEHVLRKILVVLQFVISTILVITTITISRQVKYMRAKDLGYDRENILEIRARDMSKHYGVLRNELLKNEQIMDVTAGNMKNMIVANSRSGTFWPGKPSGYDPVIRTAFVMDNFVEFMNIKLLEGDFLTPADTFKILINEEMKRVMKIENPIGQPFYMNKDDKEFYTIKGIVKNFNFELLNKRIGPLVIVNLGDYHFYIQSIYMKIKPDGAKSAIESIEKLWEQYNADYDFEYNFLDDNFDSHYKKEIYLERLLALFTAIAIFISCLGLFGLITFTAESKTKEIGIRKVLGASVRDIVKMLSKEFLILVGIAMLVAFPLASYWLERMLQDYAYRINISWWMFALTALIILIFTLLTVGFQAIKAATSNPVKAIQTE